MSDLDRITGVVLAGGKSSRMGTNKALLPYYGKPLISYPLSVLSEVFPRVVLSINEPDALSDFTSIPKILDRYPDMGPLGAILSALLAGEQFIFCVACDMPFLNSTLIQFICEVQGYDAVIPVWNGRAEVLHARYSDRLIPRIQTSIDRRVLKITEALKDSNILFLEENEIVKIDASGRSFRNLNTPEEYQGLQQNS